MKTKYIVDKLINASYWIGRAKEALDQDDIDGAFSCLNHFRMYNNPLQRSSDPEFEDNIQSIQTDYNMILEEMEDLKEVL